MFYQETIDYIKNIERGGSNYGIERMRELLVLLGEPDKNLKFVHIAGTNGKGSVSAYLTSILKESGYRVGTYNSPSVFCYNERWLIDGKPLENEQVAKYMTVVRQAIENEQLLRNAFGLDKFLPTAFEIETAVAFLAFFDNECDICVLETGLGGRWDATNVIEQKEIAVITPIGLDHCALLGNTLGEIASEKAAIAKDIVVTCHQCDEIMQQIAHPFDIENDVKKFRSVCVFESETPRLLSADLSGQQFEYDGREYAISMLGEHQLQNASIAICAVEQLRKRHWNISEDALANGLKKAAWHARFEVVKNAQSAFNINVPQGKTLVFDGSHNPHGAKTLADSLTKYFGNCRIHMVLGILKDKDVEGIVKLLVPLAHSVSCVTPPSPRALDKAQLKNIVDKYCYHCDCKDDIKVAVQDALYGDCDVVVLCGSLTLFENLG